MERYRSRGDGTPPAAGGAALLQGPDQAVPFSLSLFLLVWAWEQEGDEQDLRESFKK